MSHTLRIMGRIPSISSLMRRIPVKRRERWFIFQIDFNQIRLSSACTCNVLDLSLPRGKLGPI